MPHEIKTIHLSLPYGLGGVNCYLIQTDHGFVLIDTGSSNQRASLAAELERAGCQPGNLRLIVITHGDFDHTGNAAYLRGKLEAKIAMHTGDSGMAERGDMFWNRRKGNLVLKVMAPMLFRFKKPDRFVPDLALSDGYELVEYGCEAQVLSIPGHSKGSIGVLTAAGELFCGDLLTNMDQPVINAIMDDADKAKESVIKLKSYDIHRVYPGHGEPFAWGSFLDNLRL
jgi:hydroxyacylglutathione hydrolase